MLNIVIFGPPGSGKGTQSAKIVEKYGLVHLSTGDLLREEMARNSPLGIEVRKFIDKGLLVPDEIIMRELYEKASEYLDAQGMIFDGFPRTIIQAEMLDRMLVKREIPVSIVLSVEVEEEELFNRMMGRAQDSGRSDDQAHIIRHRIEVYKNQTLPLMDYYKKQGKIAVINGMSPVEIVFERITRAIDTYLSTEVILPEIN
ncbi:MAG: adenylate kinase [Bacteroidales bacterium]|jgi:adenylate kinase|nr:adenylate kinase [Bacteroidales bacterium]